MLIHETKKYCWAWNRVYVKANGRLPCWCDAGEPHTIVHKNHKVDFIRDVVNSPQMREMRMKILLQGRYYIKECGRCCCMTDERRGKHFRFADAERPNHDPATQARKAVEILNRVSEQRGWPLGSIDRIREIQLEPSFPCNLACPGCLQGFHKDPMSTESRPYVYPYDWFEKMMRSIVENDVTLDRIAYVGRGEPTLNRELPTMVKLARAAIPNIVMSMDSNSNQPFKVEYLLLNWINCSIDGSDQESYGTYRRGGVFNKAVEFMRAGVEKKHRYGSRCQIRWKYILFDCNDSDEHLNHAQRTALSLGIDELDLIITHCGAHDGTVKPSPRFKTLEQLNRYIDSNKIFPMTIGSRAT